MTNLVRMGTRRVSTILPSVLAIVFAADAAPAQETPTSQYGSEIQPSVCNASQNTLIPSGS